jgi:hypothetical protein
MKALSLLALPVVLTFAAASPAGSYLTSWIFTSETGGYKVSYSWDIYYNIVMPTGSQWTCNKPQVSINKNGVLVGAFYCTSGSVGAAFITGCWPAKTDSGHAHGCITDGKTDTHTCFDVGCVTTSASASGI